MYKFRHLYVNFGHFPPVFDPLFEGVQFGLQTLSGNVNFLTSYPVKNQRKIHLSCCIKANCPTLVLFCLHLQFLGIIPN